MKTNDVPLVGIATTTGARPADFPIGSLHSRAAARNLAEARGISEMQDWLSVRCENLEAAKAFARKLQSADTTNPLNVRLIVRTYQTHRQAEAARKPVQPDPSKISLTVDDEEEALSVVRLFTARHDRRDGVVIYADVSVDKAADANKKTATRERA